MSVQTSVKKANPEQEKAIYHKGGKILSAGAGSGKTFVLIEHMVSLLEDIRQKSVASEWNKKISSELSKIVLMTFTKKAAGEMSVRMMRKVEEKIAGCTSEGQAENQLFWQLVRQNLSFFTITTIHGFCHRLLSQGFWAEFPQRIELLSAIEHRSKIQRLFSKWMEQNRTQLDEVFLASVPALESSMVQIFSAPELRLLWTNPRIPSSAHEEINIFFQEYIQVKGLGPVFDQALDLSADPKEQKKKWYEYLDQFEKIRSGSGRLNSTNYSSYDSFFKSLRFPTASKEMNNEQRETLIQLRVLREDLKEFSEDLQALEKDFDHYRQWVKVFGELFKYIDDHYFELEGFSFSDLEYYALKALSRDEVLKKVQESYCYFIVDEFQDTSYIQFEILKKLIGNDKTKLFCVGDRKQAIYGFRGGELQVFEDCSQLLGAENNYFLRNNFRSARKIIEYNNTLFDRVFPLGPEYEGHDPHGVRMEAQTVPESTTLSGTVVSVRADILGEPKAINLDAVEAQLLGEQISELMNNPEIESICVLYRKLKPSSYLLDYFLEHGLAFSAQVKISFNDDPMINMFRLMVEVVLNKDQEKKRSANLYLLENLLAVLGKKRFSSAMILQFESDLSLYGVKIAFQKFVFGLGLTNSFHNQNTAVIESICRLTKGDPVRIYHLLSNEKSEEYACEMMNGNGGPGKKRILIMSAHASKGLEFDAVLLGGIHTNGRYNGMRDHVGKLPHSFRWKSSILQRRFFKSPFYHLESAILRQKDFSESKRLLYVACTRAVKHLSFANLFGSKNGAAIELSDGGNSWINALRLVHVEEQHTTKTAGSDEAIRAPLIQQDSLGIRALSEASSIGIIAELSVTRLASIAACPFKFYLQNICKISPDESALVFADELEEEENLFYSSKKRGTEVHAYLSKIFLKQLAIDQVPAGEREKISWVIDQAKDFLATSEIKSEEMVKFSFFGQMISGTPDIVFLNGEKIIVWDFKTGGRDEQTEESYRFQLMAYGYAYAMLNKFSQDKMIELSLVYVDEKSIVTFNYSVNDLTQLLFSYWKKMECLDQVNPHHCSQCEYSSICRKGTKSASV